MSNIANNNISVLRKLVISTFVALTFLNEQRNESQQA